MRGRKIIIDFFVCIALFLCINKHSHISTMEESINEKASIAVYSYFAGFLHG